MILRRICEGAVKCRFLFFLLEEDTILLNFIAEVSETRVDTKLTTFKMTYSGEKTIYIIKIKINNNRIRNAVDCTQDIDRFKKYKIVCLHFRLSLEKKKDQI